MSNARTLANTINSNSEIVVPSGGVNFGTSTDGSGTVTGGVLDDYEEGSWTPALTSSGATFTYGAKNGGTYIKIGRLLYLVGILNMTTKSGGTNSNNLSINLPFFGGAPNISGSGTGYHISATTAEYVTVPAGYYGFPQGGVCTPGGNNFDLYWTDGINNRNFRYEDVANGLLIQFSIMVYTNS